MRYLLIVSLLFLQLQQVMDSFIIFFAQQNLANVVSEESIETIKTPNSLKIPWSQFTPSTIRLAPFPTREYTDDEFQSIIKDVMGVLYVSDIFSELLVSFKFFFFCIDLDLFDLVGNAGTYWGFFFPSLASSAIRFLRRFDIFIMVSMLIIYKFHFTIY